MASICMAGYCRRSNDNQEDMATPRPELEADQTICLRAVFTCLVEMSDKKARHKDDSVEKVKVNNGVQTPRASLSMSESLKVQLQQEKQASRRTSKCQLM